MLFVERIPSRRLMRATGRKRSIFTDVKGQEKIIKKLNEFWTIVIGDAELQWHTFALQSKGDCFLSANTKLVGIDKAVLLSNKDLAQLFRDATLPTLLRRHGDAVQATVASCRTT